MTKFIRNLYYSSLLIMFLGAYWMVSYSEYLDYINYGIM